MALTKGSERKVGWVTLNAMSYSGAISASVQQAVTQFVTETEKIIKSLRDELGAEPMPPVIYHYTDSGGLRVTCPPESSPVEM